ncbi:TIGR02281 family clan AA aspartic protease [Paracoccaceae bacterium GXU_MW_L88]
MTGDDTARLLYLSLFGIAIASMLFGSYRMRLGKAVQSLGIWALIIVGAMALYRFQEPVKNFLNPVKPPVIAAGEVILTRSPDGHFYTRIEVDGVEIDAMVDTGASTLALTHRDIERIGRDPENLVFMTEVRTANGVTRGAPVTLNSVALGPFEINDMRGIVVDGQMDQALLGMNFLQHFSLTIEGNEMHLRR